MSAASSPKTLQLGTLPHPARPTQFAQMFCDSEAACTHLRDHLLTTPECHAWALVAPSYLGILDPADADCRWRYWEQTQASAGATAQALYDLYCKTTADDAADAHKLKWVRVDGRITVAVGTSGILLVVERDTVQTAFLPGQGDPEATRQARTAPSRERGLVRERGMRSGRKVSSENQNVREQAEQERREAIRTADERLYYTVFRPCLQFIKRCHHRQRNMYGRLLQQDYALLKDCLPTRNQLKYDDWLALRRQCRGG